MQHNIYIRMSHIFLSLSSTVFEVLKIGVMCTFSASYSSLKRSTTFSDMQILSRDKQIKVLTRSYAASQSGVSHCFKRATVAAMSKSCSLLCGKLHH